MPPFYQIVGPVICIYMILLAYYKYKQKQKTLTEFIIWLIIFGGAAAVAADPRIVEFAKYLTGFQDSINAAIFLSIGALFLIIFKLVLLNEQNEKRIDDIVKEMAINDFKNKYKDRYK